MSITLKTMENISVNLKPFPSCSAVATGRAIMELSTSTPTILMDTEIAEEKLYEYLHESMALDASLNKYAGDEWVYQIDIENIHATESPPRLTLEGVLKTHSVFNFLTGEVRLRFTISSVNNRIENEAQ